MNDERSTDRLAPAAVEPGMFHGAVERLTATVTEWPVATLWAVFFLTILSLGITVRFLSFRTDRSDLLDPRTDYHQRWLTFKEKFGDDSDVVIVVEADQTEQIKMVLDALGQRLEAEPDLFDRVLYRVDPTALKKKALQYLRPSDLEAVNARLEMYAPILAGHWNRAGIESYCLRLSEFLNQATKANSNVADGIIRQSRDLSLSLLQFLESPAQFASPWPEMIPAAAFPKSEQFEAEYQIASSGRMGFLLVLPRDVGKTFSGASTSLTRLREIVAEATDQFPEATIGLTGIPVLEADEMARSQQDMTVASIISFLGVGIILLIGFRGFRHPLLALMMLAVGIAWSLGYTTVVVGHLNILSVSFAAILIGLGIDFAIHYLARYLELRHHGHSLQEALVTASKTTGSGIITASITTALAFFCATFTNFLGISELGIIAGGGVLICTLVTFLVLPALIVRADRNREPRQLPTPFEGNLLRRATREHPRLVGGVSLACIIAIACQGVVWRDGQIASRVKYDYNLLNLQAQGLPSVDLQQRLFEESNGSLLYAVSLASSPQETRALKKHFLELPSVMRVEELGSYLPTYPPEETNLLVQAIHARLSRISDFPREFPQIDPLSIG
ncbi:MAG: MMPL family transporter, partial [Planctomycetaceae bacterium]|nr:MMPL family transporter [Planctomycetaceae bacterium]